MSTSRSRRLRRKQSRINYLRDLAALDYAAFSREWQRIVEGWSNEARRRARTLVDRDGSSTAMAFGVVEEVQAILRDCGSEAYEKEWPATHSVITQSCCIGLSEARGLSFFPSAAGQYERHHV